MRITKVKLKHRVKLDLKNGKSKYVIETKDHDPKLPGLFVFCGSRGSGKTYSCVAMCSHFERMKYTTRTFLISPTKQSTTIFSNLKTLDEKKDVCDNESVLKISLINIIKEIKKDWKQYEEDVEYAKVYNKYGRKECEMPLKAEMILESRNFAAPPKLKRPSHMLIVDDCQGTDMYTSARRDLINHLTISHRHTPVTICFLVQTWTGLPRSIRLNATHFILFKTGNIQQLKQIYEHFGTQVSWQDFESLYTHCVNKPHGFLYIDTEPKQEHMRFRDGFNHFVELET